MKAVIYEAYGSPDVLKLQEIAKPSPKRNEVLIKIYVTTVTSGDVTMRSFNLPIPRWQWLFARLYLGVRKPKRKILGMELAGEIEAVGQDVQRFKAGDKVFASTFAENFGAYAEYKCLKETGLLALKPQNMAYEEAAPLAGGALTALLLLRKAQLQKGQKMLIYGASGSVGTFAVQLATYLGAAVTAVCSTANLALVKSLGAIEVLDYTQDDFTQRGTSYDVIFDAVGKLEPSHAKKALKQGGLYLNVISSSNDLKLLPQDLTYIQELAEAGHLKSVIDRCYPLEELVEAHRYVDKGHKKGNVVIKI